MKLNLFSIVGFPTAFYLCATGVVSWWVFLLIILFSIEVWVNL